MADTATGGSDVLQLLLGGGAVAFIGAAYKAIKDFREGSWRRRDDAVRDLERWRDENDDARRRAQDEADMWRRRAGMLEHIIRTHGLPLPPGNPSVTMHSSDGDADDAR